MISYITRRLILFIYIIMISGCATNMLHHKINGHKKITTSKERSTIKREQFKIHKILKSNIVLRKDNKVLLACVEGTLYNTYHKDEKKINKYLISFPLTKSNPFINIDGFTNVKIGCDGINNSESSHSVNILLDETLSYIPKPMPGHASKFSLTKLDHHNKAGTLYLPLPKRFPNRLSYIENNQSNIESFTQTIIYHDRVTLIAAKKEEEEEIGEFNPNELLIVLYPFTIIWDIITTPFVIIYLLIADIH